MCCQFFMSSTAVKELADIIFANAENITDADYKKSLDLLKFIKDSSQQASVVSGGSLRCGTCAHFEDRCRRAETRAREAVRVQQQLPQAPHLPSAGVCCYTALKAACEKAHPMKVPNCVYATCGCCGKSYPTGYGTLNFRSEGRKAHIAECQHTGKKCAKCTPPSVLYARSVLRLQHREGQNLPNSPVIRVVVNN